MQPVFSICPGQVLATSTYLGRQERCGAQADLATTTTMKMGIENEDDCNCRHAKFWPMTSNNKLEAERQILFG